MAIALGVFFKVVFDVEQSPNGLFIEGKGFDFALAGPIEGDEELTSLVNQIFDQGKFVQFGQIFALIKT